MLIALDVAILLPPAVALRAMDLSAALPSGESRGLLLDTEHLPHITLSQQFVHVGDIDEFMARVDQVLQGRPPLRLRATGGAGGRTVWLGIERTPALLALHERLLDATESLEHTDGNVTAFFGGDARERDVNWVSRYRAASSFGRFLPHITLGHAVRPPVVEPFTFEASTVAVCHLGRFCSCRRVLREWGLTRLPRARSRGSRTPSQT